MDADLKSCFDTIPHEPLMARIEGKLSDGRILALLRSYLKQGVLDGLRRGPPKRARRRGP